MIKRLVRMGDSPRDGEPGRGDTESTVRLLAGAEQVEKWAFEDIDTNGDGVISREELRAFQRRQHAGTINVCRIPFAPPPPHSRPILGCPVDH